MDARTDQELVADLTAGDPSAFDAIYFRYRDWVAALALRFTGNAEDARDVTQETFLYPSRKFPGFTLTARMTTFLYPAVRNLALAMLRTRRKAIGDDFLLSESADRIAQAEAGTARAELAAVMARLPAGQREAVLMRFVDDFSMQEIAQALDIPEGTVKSRLHLALAALRTDPRVKKYFEDE